MITETIRDRGGRVVDAQGDNVLAEFGSVVQAVGAAVEIQRCIDEENRERPAERRMEFRIGINLGDVIVEGERLYGEGVNVAARLEALADAGGICISGDVHRQVEARLGLSFEDLGLRTLKNISKPVRVYRVLSERDLVRAARPELRDEIPEQEIRFCTAPDGVRLGYAIAGKGPPLVRLPTG